MPFKRFFKSFSYSIQGFKFVLKSEQNFRVQLAVGLVVLVLMMYFPLLLWERIILLLIIFAILIMEVLNTVFEYLTDLLKPRLNKYVYIIKDLMAFAVFLVSVLSIVVGILIFLPHLIDMIK